jgi:hypothetical protein
MSVFPQTIVEQHAFIVVVSVAPVSAKYWEKVKSIFPEVPPTAVQDDGIYLEFKIDSEYAEGAFLWVTST